MPLFHQGDGLGVDRWNRIYVWDALEGRIKRFSPSGTLLTWWRVPRALPLGSWTANHLAVDWQGNSTVLGNDVRRYSAGGTMLSRWGAPAHAVSVAAGGSGNIFVLSREGMLQPGNPHPSGGNARIDKYSPQGALLATWRTPLVKAGVVEPDGIAIDRHGSVFVTVATSASCYGSCTPATSVLYRFSSGGVITQTYRPGRKPFGPIAAVDTQGNLFVLPQDASLSHMGILKLTSTGTILAQAGGYGGSPQQHLVLQVEGSGRVAIASSNGRGLEPWQRSGVVRILSPSLRQITQFGMILRQPVYPMGLGISVDRAGTLENGVGLAVNRAGTLLYLTGAPSGYIYRVMTPTGKVLLQVNNPKGPAPDVWLARAIAVDGAGNVFIDDVNGSQIVKFSPNGTRLATFPLPPAYKGGSGGMALDSQGNMYVVSMSHVLKLSPAGALTLDFRIPHGPPIVGPDGIPHGQPIDGPADVSVDGNGSMYVADTFDDRIDMFSASGQPLLAWGNVGIFDRPIRLAIDPVSGHVWVADLTHAYLQEFTPRGALVARHSAYGVFPGQIIAPNSLAFDGRGRLYVLDYGNNRIQARGTASAAKGIVQSDSSRAAEVAEGIARGQAAGSTISC